MIALFEKIMTGMVGVQAFGDQYREQLNQAGQRLVVVYQGLKGRKDLVFFSGGSGLEALLVGAVALGQNIHQQVFFTGEVMEQTGPADAGGSGDVGKFCPTVSKLSKVQRGFVDHLFFADAGAVSLGSSGRGFFTHMTIIRQKW